MENLLQSIDFQLLEPLRLCAPPVRRAAFPGLRLGRAAGSSTEFAEYRPYHPGDDVRSIDWKVYARLRQRFVRHSHAEAQLTVHILLDTSQSMSAGQPPKLACARHLAAALSYVGLHQQDRVGLALFASELHQVLWPQGGMPQLARVLERLSGCAASGASDFQLAFTAYATQVPVAGSLFIVSDFFSPGGYETGLQALLAKRWAITVLHVLDDEEVQPSGLGSARLCNLEDAAQLEVTLTAHLLRQYRRDMEAFISRLRQYCQGHGLTYVPVRSSWAFAECLRALGQAGVWQRRL